MSEWTWEYGGGTDSAGLQTVLLWFGGDFVGHNTTSSLNRLLCYSIDGLQAGLRALDAWESEEGSLMREARELIKGSCIRVVFDRVANRHIASAWLSGFGDKAVTHHTDRLTAFRALVAALRVLSREPKDGGSVATPRTPHPRIVLPLLKRRHGSGPIEEGSNDEHK